MIFLIRRATVLQFHGFMTDLKDSVVNVDSCFEALFLFYYDVQSKLHVCRNLLKAFLEMQMLGTTRLDGQRAHLTENETNSRWYSVQPVSC